MNQPFRWVVHEKNYKNYQQNSDELKKENRLLKKKRLKMNGYFIENNQLSLWENRYFCQACNSENL